jgi:hypothetical protein
MNLEEAIEWLEGKRSMHNSVSDYPIETRDVRCAQMDAAMMQMAYYAWRYHRDLETDK